MNFGDYYTEQPAGDSYYQYNTGAFNFDMAAYPNLLNEPLLPPTHSNLFGEFVPNYQSYPPAPAGHPHMSVSSAQGANMYPSISDYPPSNGSYPWINSPPSATMHPPVSLSAPPVPPVPPMAPMAPRSPHDDQRVQQELLDMLDEYQHPIDTFYHNPQGFVPSPYPGAGLDSGEASPPSSIIKSSFDEDLSDDGDLGLDLEDLELPDGVTEGDLSALKIPDLNKKLRELGLSRDDQNLVKKIRRQHKNRRYAHTCRQKKVDKKNTMKVQKQVLESEINELKMDVESLRRERDEFKNNYELMQKRKQEGIRA